MSPPPARIALRKLSATQAGKVASSSLGLHNHINFLTCPQEIQPLKFRSGQEESLGKSSRQVLELRKNDCEEEKKL